MVLYPYHVVIYSHHEGIQHYMAGIARWLRRLPAAFGSKRRLVGEDTRGNKYYEVLLSERTARVVETGGDEDDYDNSRLPSEWQCNASGCNMC